jgi:hypothetical protein
VGVDHGGFDIFMSQEFLHRSDIVPILEQVGGEGMAKGMGGDRFIDFRSAGRSFDRSLKVRFVQMVTLFDPAHRVYRENGRWKYVLPGKFPVGIWILSFQGIGEINRPVSIEQITLMLCPDLVKLKA